MKKEADKIVQFIKGVFIKQKFVNVVIAVSGGIDSATCLYLLAKALPVEHIFVVHLSYIDSEFSTVKSIALSLGIPSKNISQLPIKPIVDEIAKRSDPDRVRLGNIMARVRMTLLYDLAKKLNALVCGTENKSEYSLGYFTRFGDSASDFEPIQHLYKTQVYQLAHYLGVPAEIINKVPTAGLWSGQTDEKEFGFTYREADEVLQLYFDKKLTLQEIIKKSFKNAERIINRALTNQYKHQTPYIIEETK